MQEDKRKEMLEEIESICKDQIDFAKTGMELINESKEKYEKLIREFKSIKNSSIGKKDQYEVKESEYWTLALKMALLNIDLLQGQLFCFCDGVESLLRSI